MTLFSANLNFAYPAGGIELSNLDNPIVNQTVIKSRMLGWHKVTLGNQFRSENAIANREQGLDSFPAELPGLMCILNTMNHLDLTVSSPA